jgi:hypothetical protein
MQLDFPWCYGRTADDRGIPTNPFLFGFVRTIVNDGNLIYDPYRIIESSVRNALGYAGENVKSILRIRCILNTAADKNYQFGNHVDLTQPHKVALIYLNDSDGDTIVYNESFNPLLSTSNGEIIIDDRSIPVLSVKQTITPKANRMAMFDGHLYHSGNTPTTVSRRVAININYITEEEIIPHHTPIQTLILI